MGNAPAQQYTYFKDGEERKGETKVIRTTHLPKDEPIIEFE